MMRRNKPYVVSVRHKDSSYEDESPTMATPLEAPLVIILRPSWLDLPARKMIGRFTLLAICSIPGLILITAVVRAAWRIL